MTDYELSLIVCAARGERLWMWCPGCEDLHCASFGGWQIDTQDIDRPTISPSLLVNGVQWSSDYPEMQKRRHAVAPGQATACHSFVRDGQWEFLSDCTHDLAGQTVPLPPLPMWFVNQDQEAADD